VLSTLTLLNTASQTQLKKTTTVDSLYVCVFLNVHWPTDSFFHFCFQPMINLKNSLTFLSCIIHYVVRYFILLWDNSIRTINKSQSGEKNRRNAGKGEGISMISSCGDPFYEGDQSSNEKTGEFMCGAYSRRTDKIPRDFSNRNDGESEGKQRQWGCGGRICLDNSGIHDFGLG